MTKQNSLQIPQHVQTLLKKGVVIPCPASVELDQSIDPERIAPGVVIHSGCRISGEKTSIGPDCVIGAEAPATVENCRLGNGVALKGGYFSGAVFLDGANMGSGAHIRPGTLLEEEANGAHTVGFKQTILLPFVTVGSLINFCDCLMAGGTSRKNHSEVGSSYIHFNFTPHGDKATPSLIGDVPRGVMLDQAPIFLGGQGGLVGPARIEYGCVIPSGVVQRGDALESGQLLLPREPTSWGSRPYQFGMYRNISKIITNNLIYIGNIRALQAWYLLARERTTGRDIFSMSCYDGALEVIDLVLKERVKRLGALASKMDLSIKLLKEQAVTERISAIIAQQQSLSVKWPEIDQALRKPPEEETGAAHRDNFLSEWERIDPGTPHTKAVSILPREARKNGTAWLQAIVNSVTGLF